MSKDNKLAIYAVETPVESKIGDDVSYHSFLLLADVTNVELKPLQELHFVFSERQTGGVNSTKAQLKKVPCLKAITKPANRDYSKMHFNEFIESDRESVLAQWNKMVDISGSIGSLNIAFIQGASKQSVNCRTGTKAVLEALGYEFEPLIDGAESGSGVAILDKLPSDVIIVDATPKAFSPDMIRNLQGMNFNF